MKALLALGLSLVTGLAAAQVGPSAAEATHYTGLHAAAWRGDAARLRLRLRLRLRGRTVPQSTPATATAARRCMWPPSPASLR